MLSLFNSIFAVFVQQAPDSKKRTYDKKNCCFYCQKEFAKLARHLQQIHKDEDEVKLAFSFPKTDSRRKEELTKIRKMGNFNHNLVVLETNEGELKVDRRPSENINPMQYLPCKECNGFFLKHELSRHASTCILKKDDRCKTSLKQLKYEGKLMLATTKDNGCIPQLRETVISKMASDEITAVAETDVTILNLGSALLEKRGKEKANEVSQNMRLLARILMETRKLSGDNTASVSSIIAPKNFDMLLQCAKNLGGFVESEDGTKQYKSPSTSIKCGYILKKAALILRGQALRNADMAWKKEIDMFLELYDAEWGGKITTPAHGNLALKKHNAPNLLPITNDLLTLRTHIVQKIETLTKEVSSDANRENFRELSEVSLARLIMFNKRRGNLLMYCNVL